MIAIHHIDDLSGAAPRVSAATGSADFQVGHPHNAKRQIIAAFSREAYDPSSHSIPAGNLAKIAGRFAFKSWPIGDIGATSGGDHIRDGASSSQPFVLC